MEHRRARCCSCEEDGFNSLPYSYGEVDVAQDGRYAVALEVVLMQAVLTIAQTVFRLILAHIATVLR